MRSSIRVYGNYNIGNHTHRFLFRSEFLHTKAVSILPICKSLRFTTNGRQTFDTLNARGRIIIHFEYVVDLPYPYSVPTYHRHFSKYSVIHYLRQYCPLKFCKRPLFSIISISFLLSFDFHVIECRGGGPISPKYSSCHLLINLTNCMQVARRKACAAY